MEHCIAWYLVVGFWLAYSTCADSSNEPAELAIPRRHLPRLEDLVQTSELVHVMWNISSKYNLTEKSNETCIAEIDRNRSLLPYYIANITLGKTADLLHFYRTKEIGEYNGNEISFANKIYRNRTKLIDDQEQYYMSLKGALGNTLVMPGDGDICFSDSDCGCISRIQFQAYESQFIMLKEIQFHLKVYIIFGTYIESFFRILIIIFGLVLNGVLLFILIREKTVRTESNLLIYNLCVTNFLTVLVYLPIHYVCTYHLYDTDDKGGYIVVQIFIVSANTLTVLLLNIQRYFDVSRIMNTNAVENQLTSTTRCAIYLAIIWGCSSGLGLCFALMDSQVAVALQSLLYFLVYVFVFSIVLAVFNSMTARKLQRAAEQGRHSDEFQHLTGASLILALTIVFYVSHVLFFIYNMFEVVMGDISSYHNVPLVFRIIMFFLHMVYFSYAWLNTLVLYKASSTYRNFFRMYLFRCWHKQEAGQYVTMSSVQNNETQS